MSGIDQIESSLCSFANKVYEQTLESASGKWQNMFMAPLSIYAVMSMTLAGSAGITKSEMLQALQMPHSFGELQQHQSIGSTICGYFKPSEGVDLSLANRLFVSNVAQITTTYAQALSKYYKAEAENMDFVNNAESSRNRINAWVEERTKQKIKELLAPGTISSQTCAVIANAIYFKGLWDHKFDKQHTINSKFYKLDGSTVNVNMMFISEKFPLLDLPELDAQAIKLPFHKSSWEMLIVLSNAKDGLPNVVKHLRKPNSLSSILSSDFYSTKVELSLPRFKVGEGDSIDAKALLIKMGMKTVFDAGLADLSGISSSSKIFLSDVSHKAILEVDEEGATAAAATAAIATFCCIMHTPSFRVDHPFFIALVCDKKVPVFLGHVTDPHSL